MAKISDYVWREMLASKEFQSLCKKELEFNHTTVQVYHKGAAMKPHEDRNKARNSMKKGSAVAVLTLGMPRNISFYRTFKDPISGKETREKKPCSTIQQEHGTIFVLHPDDETKKGRQNAMLPRTVGTHLLDLNC